MKIRKYQNSGKLNKGEIHIDINPVTITPEPGQYDMRDNFLKEMDSEDRKMAIKIFDNMFNNSHLSNKTNGNHSNMVHDRGGRLYNLGNWADRPKVKSHNGRAFYNPLTNTIHSNPTSIMSELAHPLQSKYGTKSVNPISIGKTLMGEIFRVGRRIFNADTKYDHMISNDMKPGGAYDHYDDPAHYEFDTHKTIEKQMNDYLYLPPKYEQYHYMPEFLKNKK